MNKKTMSFHRQYWAYSGGHQKVRDYLLHTASSDGFEANLWSDNVSRIQPRLFMDLPGVTQSLNYEPQKADIAFLAGMDWQAYQPFYDEKQVKINLIQHIRHGNKNHPLHAFLRHKAIRLCVSDAVKDAITPYANGPCYTIRMGHEIPQLSSAKIKDLYILATKQAELGQQIFDWAQARNLRVILHSTPVEREQVYSSMAESKLVIALPNKTEGFFLPGIEAMALADWAIVPDCIASREYSSGRANILSCALTFEGCTSAILAAQQKIGAWNLWFYKWLGKRICAGYKLSSERKNYLNILNNIEHIW